MKTLYFILVLFTVLLLSTVHAQRSVIIELSNIHQLIRGFGAANILQWRPDMTNSEIETAFGTDDGQLGFTILRLRIQPQTNLWSTNVATAKKAHDMGVTIIASPWNPPDDMLDPESESVRKVNPDMYEDYAYHLDDFVFFMEGSGVPIYAVSVQNEPDWGDWTRWTSGEMLTFMRENASIIQTRVMAPESFQFRHDMSDPILNDSAACANLDIVAGHVYGAGAVTYPLAESKGKELWMTEHYTESENSGNLWPLALEVGTAIHHVMVAGMSSYVWWYIVRFYGPISDGTNNSGSKGDVTKRGYIMSQFSRFIRPGYYRIKCNNYPQSNVFTTAYRDNISSKIVIVAINNSTETKNQRIIFEDCTVGKFIPYVTSETKNCNQEDDVLVSNDTLVVTLNGESITTFVSSGDIIVPVENSSYTPELSFKLYQNYPNPFNPSTRINFEIPEKTFVSLKVYNILGQEIDELAGKEYYAGSHSVIFDASNLANGIYFYTLRTSDFIKTKKMFIIK